MPYKIILVIFIFFLNSCVLQRGGPPYIKEIAPLSNVPGLGVSFKIPNEEGWMLFDPDGRGSTIVKFGKTNIESYVISLQRYKQPVPSSFSEFNDLYEALKKPEISAPRFKAILIEDGIREVKKDYSINFYYLTEDRHPVKTPSDQEYLLLESMGFFTVHPNIPNTMLRIAYSYRHAKGHEDPKFKEKAKWVLNNLVFTSE